MRPWLAGLLLILAITGPVGADEDLSLISEVERLRQSVELCRADRQQREDQTAIFRAYILKLEQRVKDLGQASTPHK